MKKVMIFCMLLLLLAVPAYAILDSDTDLVNITLNFPTNNTYNASGSSFHTSISNLILNATVRWTGVANGAGSYMNITNVTFVFVSGINETRFMNTTVNGTRTTVTSGDFTFNLSSANFSEKSWTVHVEARNQSDNGYVNINVINSSKIAYTIDRSGGTVVISEPYVGSTVVPNNKVVSFNYVPTETNLGNCSLNINNQLIKSSTSGTTSPNVSSGLNNRFTHEFGADNLSIRVAIRCIDLAGIGTSDTSLNNFTFNVLVGAISPAIRQRQLAAASGGVPLQTQKPAFSSVPQFSSAPQRTANINSAHLQKWAWAYVIGVVLVVGLFIRKYWK